MELGKDERRAVELSQGLAHGEDHDYTVGSPHLRHAALRHHIDQKITAVVRRIVQQNGKCTVLEIGAGHGSFTDIATAAGANVTVTEMSAASYAYLAKRYRDSKAVRVLYDADGSAPFQESVRYDVVLLISVIHHIPDYMSVLDKICAQILAPGGTILTFQDPLWYPRQSLWPKLASSGAYFAWRLTQGDLKKGIETRWRRLRGVLSEDNPSDLVEYHVVRQGVDDLAMYEYFEARFAEVGLDKYFSTQAPLMQRIGQKCFPPNTFGITAHGFGRNQH